MTRLKLLELQGYKTFASKAQFDFPGDITAVVGPNGSGKSNIADAIRWVLGEQAYSVLRGKKTEDMIFTGSELRPRAGMAMASITFNNDDGWLPIDFSEVVISRRAYRDGENEYLLNNQKVRLKEINELLSQTGLSERTYTIIGQGLVDAALSLKPDERRKFFEEAAGIGLFRSRRDESINRLEATKRNLERVNDIISELGPRVNSLERQAKKVQEYERIRSDLRLMLRDWYGFQWNKNNAEVLGAATILKEREKTLEKARNTAQKIEENYRDFHDEMQSLRDQLIAHNQKLSQLHIDRESTTRDLAVFEERMLGIKARKHDLEIQIATINEEIKSNDMSISSLDSELNSIDREVTEVLAERDNSKADLDTRTKERGEIEESIKKLDEKRVNLNTQKIEKEIRLEHLIQSDKEQNESCALLQSQIEAYKVTLEEVTSKITESSIGAKNLERDIAVIQTKIIECEQILHLHGNNLVDNHNLHVSRAAELDSLIQRKKFYTNAKTQMVGASEGAKRIVELMCKNPHHRITGFLHQHLKVPKKYEKAVNSSLLDAIDTVILDSETNLDEIISLIPRETNQFTYLFRLPDIKFKEPALITKKSNHPRLQDLISFPEEIKDLIENLLSNYYFIDREVNIFDALQNLPRGSVCVTEFGDMYQKNGLIVFAGDGRQSGITFAREIEETEKLISETELEINKIKNNNDEEQTHVDQATIQIDELNEELSLLNHDLQNIKVILLDYQNQFEKITGTIEWNEKQMRLVSEKCANNTLEIESLKKSLLDIKERQSELEAVILMERTKLDLIPVDPIINILNEKEQNYQRVNQKSQLFKAQKEDKNQQNQLKKLKVASLVEQQKENQEEIATLEQKIHDISEQIDRIKDQISDIYIFSRPLESEISEKENQNQAYIKNLGTARQSLTMEERFFAQAQLDYSRQRDKLDNLRSRIEDDFGLVAFTYAEEVEGPSPLPFEGLVEQLPNLTLIPENLEESILRQRAVLRRIGPINQEADREYQESKQRLDFLNEQVKDLIKADEDLRKVIGELDVLIRSEFKKTFDSVAKEFHVIFGQLFVGGSARLLLSESDDPEFLGVDIEAKLPGRREQGLSLLSGGERSLTATALIFALLRVSPTPFCVLDEVDAMLDESNVGRFCDLLKELSAKTQFIVITHNRNTVQAADVIYGVTMGKDSASQVIGLKLDELSEEMIKST